ncbi:MAG: ArsA family ATPase [Candidatus Korobacteraceae bacterium]
MFTFFIGKGGVGKTTVSSAYALHRVAKQPKRRILLMSTDPAHSLADVLQVKLSDIPKRLRTPGQLWARQIDAEKQIHRFLRSEREEILALLERGGLFTRDELEPLLDTSLPGMAEVAALLAIHQLLGSKYDEVVVDTAPMGHAIRLFQMPQHFTRFLDVLETAASRDAVLARTFGGRVRREPALDRWARMVDGVEQALSSGGSKLVMVTTPEPFSLNEAARSAACFQGSDAGERIDEIVLNRVVEAATDCSQCRYRIVQSRAAHKFLRTHFPPAMVLAAEDPGCPILGIDALRQFGRHIFAGRKFSRSIITKPPKAVSFKLEAATWPDLVTPLTLTLGKGGVGKTTVSAGLAYHHRKLRKSDGVVVGSIDPAPSLADVFATKLGNKLQPVLRDRQLQAVEVDAMADFQRWTSELRARLNDAMTGEQSGIHLDVSLDRKFLLALLDVVPPGVDEIFAIFRILDLLPTGDRVVIDMAPTGHALEVLRTPARLLAWTRVLLKTLAAHRTLPIARDAAVEVATLSQNVRQLASILRDKKRCRLVVVTLPEPLPDYETRRLMMELRELKVPLGAVFVNRVLTDGGGCSRCKLAAEWQAASLASLRRQLRGSEIFIVPEFEAPIAGVRGLQQLTRKVFRLA